MCSSTLLGLPLWPTMTQSTVRTHTESCHENTSSASRISEPINVAICHVRPAQRSILELSLPLNIAMHSTYDAATTLRTRSFLTTSFKETRQGITPETPVALSVAQRQTSFDQCVTHWDHLQTILTRTSTHWPHPHHRNFSVSCTARQLRFPPR